MALDVMWEVISDKRQLKLQENQEWGLITEKSILKVGETNKIRGICRVICETPEKPSEIELRRRREIETAWEFLDESMEVNSADQIDQLNALRFKMKMGSKNLSRA